MSVDFTSVFFTLEITFFFVQSFILLLILLMLGIEKTPLGENPFIFYDVVINPLFFHAEAATQKNSYKMKEKQDSKDFERKL